MPIIFGGKINPTFLGKTVTFRGEAQAIYAQAEKAYNDGIKNVLLGTHDAHKYWSTIKSALFGLI